MEIFEAFTAHLLAQTGLTALIGDRIYPYEASEGDPLPYIVYQNISDVKNHTLEGQNAFENPVYQFTVYDSDPVTIKAIGRQIKAALSDYHGTMSGLNVQYIELLNELSSKYNNTDGSLNCYTLDLEYQIYFDYE